MKNLLISASVGAIIACFGISTAVAQEVASGSSADAAVTPQNGLEEIIVTARKRSENLQTTPVAVSAVSAETLQRNQIVRIDDLQKAVPSLVIFANPSLIGAANFAIRGLTATDYIPTSDAPVAVYLDGVYLARPFGALFNLTDLERIEVLRGPQGTLNGRNATAGSIALFTKGPSDEFGIQQKLSYGTFNDFMTRTIVDTGAIGNSGLSFRGAYMHHQADGYIRNILSTPSNSPGSLNSNSAFLAARGSWGRFTADYKLDYNRETGQGGVPQIVDAIPRWLSFFQTYNPGFELQPGFRKTLAIKTFPKSTQRTFGHSLTLRLDVSPAFQLKSITGLRSLHTTYASYNGAYPQLFGNVTTATTAAGLPAPGAAPFSVQPIDISIIPLVTINQRQISQEFQLTGKASRFSYTAGVYLFKEHANQTYAPLGSLSTIVLTPTTGRYGIGGKLDFSNYATSIAAYGQISYTPPILDDRMEVTAGSRWTRDTKHLIQTNPAPGTALVAIPRDVSRSFSNISSEGSIKIQWTPRVMTYFRAAQAYKAGGISPRDTTFSATGYEPEKAVSYELGVKADLFDQHARLNLDVYHTDYKNLQIFQTFVWNGCPSSVCSTVINAGAATYNGIEAELTVIPVRGLELRGNIGYVDPKYSILRINPAVDIANSPSVRYTYLAKLTSNASVEYRFEPAAFGELSARVSWTHQSERYFGSQSLPTNFLERIKDPSFDDISAQVVLASIPVPALSNVSMSIYGANLLDRHRVLQGIDVGTYAEQTFGPGRTFGISLTAQYR